MLARGAIGAGAALALALAGCGGKGSALHGDGGAPDGGTTVTTQQGFPFGTPGPWPVANAVYGAADGIRETPVVGFTTDESQNRWVATPQALYLLRPGDRTFRRFDGADGLHTQSNPALYCGIDGDIPAPPGATSCKPGELAMSGGAKDPGITEIAGGGPNEVFVGYFGSEPVLDPLTAFDSTDPGRHDGKIDRVRLKPDGTLAVDRFDMLANQHGRHYWHDRTIERLLYDHLIHPHTLYSGSNHGVTMFFPDRFTTPTATLGFDASIDQYMSDHLHAQVCYHQTCDSGGSQRMGDWRGLALDANGDLWHAGRWTAGLIRWYPVLAHDILTGDGWAFRGGAAFAEAFGEGSPPVFPAPLEGDAVNMTAVAVAKDGTVWFSSRSTGGGVDGIGYGVATWRRGQGFTYYDPGQLGLPEHDVSDLAALPDGRIVLAGPTGGLSFYDPATGTSKAVRAGQGIADDHVNRIEVDQMVNPTALHVATDGGAAVLRVLP